MNQHYSNKTDTNETISFLLSLGLPALPIAPVQTDEQYWKRNKVTREVERDNNGNPILLYTGKNPSYLNQQGEPKPIYHSGYRDKTPMHSEVSYWFSNSENGIGTLCGINNIIFIDFDTKHFDSLEDFESILKNWFEQYPQLKNTWIERTHSNGYRVAVKVKQKPNFTNFGLEPEGKHIGEALGEGKFTVLAPTIGPSGNSYQVINRVSPLEVDSLESIGIYSIKKQKTDRENISTAKSTAKLLHGSRDAIPLRFLGKESTKELLNGNSNTNDRSEALTAAIREWHGWDNWAANNDIPVSEDVEDLATEAGILLGIDSDRIKRIYNSVDETDCYPAAHYEGGEKSCWRKIYSLNKEVYDSQCPEDIKEEIRLDWEDYKNSNCRSVELTVEPTNSPKSIQYKDCRSVEVVEPNSEELEELEFTKDRVNNLMNKKSQTLDLSDCLHESLANPLKYVAEGMPTSPEMLLTTLLPVAASLIGTSAKVQLWNNWTEPSIVWTMNIAPTGSMKSPAMDVIINPLWGLESMRNSNPESDEVKDYIVSDFTMESLIQVHSLNPRGLLAFRDELDGFFQSMNKYRQGKGDDQQQWLTLNAGKPIKVNRKSDVERYSLTKTAISITGSIQPEILRESLSRNNIHSGFSARWIYCCPEMPSAKYTGKEPPIIDEILIELYSKLELIAENTIFSFSERAKECFISNWYNPIVERGEEETNPFISSVLAKWRGYCARIALLLHCINEATSKLSGTISTEISTETIIKAISLSDYYISQAELIHGLVSDSDDQVPKEWIRLMELSKKGGWLTGRTASQGTKLVSGTENARRIFIDMAKAGFGTTEGEGNKLKWRYSESSETSSTLLQSEDLAVA